MKCWLTDEDRKAGRFCRSFECQGCNTFKNNKLDETNPPKGSSGVPKLPESPFKETEKLAEKLLLDIADKTDKALVDSLNDLIKAGILEVRIMNPVMIEELNNYTVKSGVQVVPKFDEYTKKLESENSELKKQLFLLGIDQTRRIRELVDYSNEIRLLNEKLKKWKNGYLLASEGCNSANRKLKELERELKASRQASECLEIS